MQGGRTKKEDTEGLVYTDLCEEGGVNGGSSIGGGQELEPHGACTEGQRSGRALAVCVLGEEELYNMGETGDRAMDHMQTVNESGTNKDKSPGHGSS